MNNPKFDLAKQYLDSSHKAYDEGRFSESSAFAYLVFIALGIEPPSKSSMPKSQLKQERSHEQETETV